MQLLDQIGPVGQFGENYRNTNYRNANYKRSEYKIAEVKNYKLQRRKITNYRNTENAKSKMYLKVQVVLEGSSRT